MEQPELELLLAVSLSNLQTDQKKPHQDLRTDYCINHYFVEQFQQLAEPESAQYLQQMGLRGDSE